MNNVIRFINVDLNERRKECRFINRNVNIKDEYGGIRSYPCIVLYEIETGIPLFYTGLEKYISSLVISENMDGGTLAKKAIGVCNFLNYLLYHTSINSLYECTITTVRDYLIYSRKKESGELYNHDTWLRYRTSLFDFLSLYYKANNDVLPFKYNGNDLQTKIPMNGKKVKGNLSILVRSGLNVKGPKTTHKKNRILAKGYLELLMYEAKKYDPEIVLAIALQAYAGLREGEIVNMTFNRFSIIRRQFATISTIELNLLEPAPHFINWSKKTKPGSIKKFRIQKVYDDFLNHIIDVFNSHTILMESKGYKTIKDAPLFINYQGKPMTVYTYTTRLKNLFYNYFLPSLKVTCDKQNTWAENAAFFEIYEQEYPGAHMFRHWFTMYLLTRAKLSSGEIMKWRGDSNQESMNSYIHENSDLIELYRESTYTFQSQLLDDIRSDYE